MALCSICGDDLHTTIFCPKLPVTYAGECMQLRAALAESQRREKVLRSAVEFAEKKAVEFRYPFLIQEMQKALAETQPGEEM